MIGPSCLYVRDLFAREVVSQGFRWLLGREPESENVIYGHLRATEGDWRRVRSHIMQSPEFFGNAVSISRDGQSPANRVLTVIAIFKSLYEREVFSDEDFIRLYLAYCYKNRSYLERGELGLAVELMIRRPELIDIVFDEMRQYEEWTRVAQTLKALGRAIKCFRDRQYDSFEMLLADVDWQAIDAHRQAFINRTSSLAYISTLRPPLAARPLLANENILNRIRKFYSDISASCFVDSLLECVIEEGRLVAFASCDLSYYSAFADLLAGYIGGRSVFLVIILCCSDREEASARAIAIQFNEKFVRTALTIVQVHQGVVFERSFYTVPRLLALAFWVCMIGREGVSLDIDVLCGPKFDQPAEGTDTEKWDVALPIKPDGWPWAKVFAGYIRVKPTSGGRGFARAFLTYLLEMVDPLRYQWHIDQNALLSAYLRGLQEKNVEVCDVWKVFREVIFISGPGGLRQKKENMEKEIISGSCR